MLCVIEETQERSRALVAKLSAAVMEPVLLRADPAEVEIRKLIAAGGAAELCTLACTLIPGGTEPVWVGFGG